MTGFWWNTPSIWWFSLVWHWKWMKKILKIIFFCIIDKTLLKMNRFQGSTKKMKKLFKHSWKFMNQKGLFGWLWCHVYLTMYPIAFGFWILHLDKTWVFFKKRDSWLFLSWKMTWNSCIPRFCIRHQNDTTAGTTQSSPTTSMKSWKASTRSISRRASKTNFKKIYPDFPLKAPEKSNSLFLMQMQTKFYSLFLQ